MVMIAIQEGVIVASYRQRGKNKLWDYRIFDKKGKVIATNSGFKTKCEAMNEAQEKERKLFQSNYTARFDSKVSLYELWKDWYDLVIFPSEKALVPFIRKSTASPTEYFTFSYLLAIDRKFFSVLCKLLFPIFCSPLKVIYILAYYNFNTRFCQ